MGRALWLLLVVPLQVAMGQDPAGVDSVGDFHPAASVLSLILIPKVIGDVCMTRDFVRSEEFAAIRKTGGDLRAVDALYRRALRLSWNNTWEALLIATLASLDHRRVGIRLLGFVFWFPLTSEFEEEFGARVGRLPARLYPDTPPDQEGDRDKLQHFFGSALLTFMFESPGPAERAGAFVEWGEDLFVVGGVNDERDLRADLQGAAFGSALLVDRAALPSTFLTAAPRWISARPPWEDP